jgi:hypothetical protein
MFFDLIKHLTIMKNLKRINFAVLAFICGSGLALTTSAFKPFADNVYNDTNTPGAHNWQAIPPGETVSCSSDMRFDCTGVKDANGNVTPDLKGHATLIP